ncbi:DMT family transporter [Metabacillus bambusae]|uniref:Multidrug resistance efflux transporter family protein n=1 Tax=Metabacillus bambusae TaxID=2795218 RepID=A0ABS3N622_9BACI|nr:multidrug resistance efflux transporter family protein [Metabacillus bambusae]MBO1513605.1 multidrug resistance efflux transporter family protein [Metabacillus bambusae]
MRSIVLGICSSFFFAFTFVLNRSMELSGGSWLWSASLRYFFMLPFLFFIVIWRKKWIALWKEMKKNPSQWLLWGTIGFGLFYAPICFAGAYGPGWLIAATWQITILSGSLLVPLFYEEIKTTNGSIKVRGQIPFKGLCMSLIIIIGVGVMQYEHATQLSIKPVLLSIIPVIIASFAYPLGNRKMMSLCEGRLDVFQRVLGMTLGSLPFWITLSIIALSTTGLPSKTQTVQSFFVAICSGLIATLLFFQATNLVQHNMAKLAAVEATQSIQVLFALFGEILFLSAPLPTPISLIGMVLVVGGMVLHSYVSRTDQLEVTPSDTSKQFS